jgi:hypothetical protein
MVYPVLLGTGKHIFGTDGSARSFELQTTKGLPDGLVVSTYKLTGPLKAASASK